MTELPIEPEPAARFNPDAFAMNLARAMENSGKALAAYLKPRENAEPRDKPPNEFAELIKTFSAVAEYWLSDQTRAAELQAKLGKAYLDLWGDAARRLSGEEVKPAIEPAPRDKRFIDPEWRSNQFFDFLMQAYLLTTQWANELVRDAEGIDPHTRKKAEFYVQQITNAIAPSNFVMTNPEVLRETLRLERRQSRARHEDAGGGHRGRKRHAAHPPVRLRQSRGRRQHGDDAGQGDLPERADATDPVFAGDRRTCCAPRC